MGQFNIKDTALVERVRRIAERKQTTMIEVLRQAVEAQELRDDERIAARLKAIQEITERSAKLFPPDWDGDHSYLYDENGLPK